MRIHTELAEGPELAVCGKANLGRLDKQESHMADYERRNSGPRGGGRKRRYRGENWPLAMLHGSGGFFLTNYSWAFKMKTILTDVSRGVDTRSLLSSRSEDSC